MRLKCIEKSVKNNEPPQGMGIEYIMDITKKLYNKEP